MHYVTRFRSACFWLTLLLAGLGRVSRAQEQPLPRLQQQFTAYQAQTLQEKLFVHTDRSFYLTGEVMWFRLFYVDGSLHRPLDVSKVAYLELLDKDQKAVLQTKVALNSGKGMGSLLLPTYLPSGSYVFRAYTHWMKTASPDFLFEKPLTIVNPFRKLGPTAAVDSLAYTMQLFPEGGNLVSGLPGKVAFKLVDPKTERGLDCQGVLLNQANDTLARFNTLRFGIGTFSFTPVAGNKYRVLLKDRRGRTLSRSLPTIQERGYTMLTEDADADHLKVTVRATGLPTDSSIPTVSLITHTRQSIKVAEMHPLQASQTTFLVPKQKLGEGISHLTLFDAAGQPVCERLYFKRPQHNLTIQLKPDKDQYTTRAPVALNLTASTPSGTPALLEGSVAVYRIDSLQTGEAISLPGFLLLTSDLRGTVESPEYYLTHTGPEADAAVDNLMLTHGWRRFRWDALLQPRSLLPGLIPEYKGLMIRGRVTDTRTGAPARNVMTYLSVPGRAVRVASSRSDEQGMVRFEMANFTGPNDVVLQTGPPDSLYQVDIINPFTETAASTRLPPLNVTANLGDELLTRSLSMQVQNSYYHQYVSQTDAPPTDSSSFFGRADEHYVLSDYTRFTVLEEVLSEYVPGVQVHRRNKHYSLRVNNLPYRLFFNEDPLVLLDGVPVFDTDRLMAISPLKIKTLDVVTRRYFLGYSTIPGIISFRTFKGDLAGLQLDPRSVTIEYGGLQSRREFSAPQYATAKQLESRLPDFRNLLYWNPQLMTDAQGKAQLHFFTSDQEGNYLIVVHGLTADGRFSTAQSAVVVRSLEK